MQIEAKRKRKKWFEIGRKVDLLKLNNSELGCNEKIILICQWKSID